MARPHWLTPAGATTTPRVIVSFDTECHAQEIDGSEVLTLRCWDAVIRSRRQGADLRSVVAHRSGEAASDLADLLGAAAEIDGECWAFAHNLGFDLTVTSLPMVLSQAGWETEFVNLGDETCVFILERDGCKLVITDSWSWLRSPLSAAARDVGMRTGRLPAQASNLADWHRRCAHDVAILDRLLGELLDWWDATQPGAFGITGSACGWRTLRAMVPSKAVLVGTEEHRTAFERSALHGGRKEVWRVGEIKGRWVADYDLIAAHLTTVAHLPLPNVPLRGERIGLIADPLAPPEGVGTICEVEITTQTPCAPVKIDGDVWWPVGRFRTVLSSVELAEVVKAAERVEVLQAQWYRLTDALAPWGRWCLDLLDDGADDIPAVVRRVAKGWGRAVPGRFALRVATLIGERPATHLGWGVEQGVEHGSGAHIEMVSYGGRERTYRKDQDGADVNPAVLAFVEGYLRAAMAATLALRPPERLLQVNTDGWWEVCADSRETVGANECPAPYNLSRRAHVRGVKIIGPNHVTTADERRLSGIPKDAREDEGGAFTWQDWPGLRWQLQYSRPGEYLRPRKGMALQPHYCRRWVLTTGETVPASVDLSRDGAPLILPWAQTAQRRHGDRLAQHQVPALHALRDGGEPLGASTLPAGSRPYGRL